MADRVVTVSPAYKDEILSPEGGFGLQVPRPSRPMRSAQKRAQPPAGLQVPQPAAA
jgi:hypothetical protein